MTSPSRILGPADIRPMPYGRTAIRNIRNAICEPLWGGRRVLIHVAGSAGTAGTARPAGANVSIRDEVGEGLDGYDLLREAIGETAQADEAVFDGYLLPAPLRDTTGAEAVIGLDSVESTADVSRRLLFGGGFGGHRREEAEAARARRFALPSSSPTAFVAIDLLWLEGESLLEVPLAERKRLLDSALLDADVVRRTMAVRAPVEAWYAQWRALGFREFAAKDANSRYTPGVPSPAWGTALIPKR